MLLPGMVIVLLFSILPMVGIVIAFQDFNPGRGLFQSEWVGYDNFRYMFELPEIKQVLMNTVSIAIMKIIGNMIFPLMFALMLHETVFLRIKRWVQTIVYLPHFLSWVILSGILLEIFSYRGVVNQFIGWFGFEPILFISSNSWFRPILVGSDIWKEFGFGTIIYLAALTGINPALYEAAELDGASRWQRLRYITMPGITTTIILLATLSLGNVLNAGFDQIFNMYNARVYDSADIIDTYVFRAGINNLQYGFATAVGLLKSVVSFVLIIMSYVLASRLANYRIF
ncbi:ABC transporter permease [Cohnella abietis]|nr:ABC transporter permease subunit [Cohnella abietis]